MRQEFSTARNTVTVEITIRDENLDLKEHAWAVLELWDEDEFIELLRERLQKSQSEVLVLLASYQPVTSSSCCEDRNERPW
jgi:hypothetical protein